MHNAAPNQEIKEGECILHIVQSFETLSEIALKFDMTVSKNL